MATEPSDLDFCYLTTTGHRSGEPHRIEIWFALRDGVVYMLSGGGEGSHWVQNILHDPRVVLELGEQTRATLARRVTEPDEDALARRLLVEKYRSRDPDDLGEWGRMAMPMAVEWRSPAS